MFGHGRDDAHSTIHTHSRLDNCVIIGITIFKGWLEVRGQSFKYIRQSSQYILFTVGLKVSKMMDKNVSRCHMR